MFSLPHQRPRRNGAAAQSGSTPETVGRPRCGARPDVSCPYRLISAQMGPRPVG